MKRNWIRLLLLVCAALVSSSRLPAQYQPWGEPPKPRWHLTGALGFDFANITNDSYSSLTNGSQTNRGYGGEISTNLSGFLIDPRLFDFNANVNDLQAASSTNAQGNSFSLVATRNRALSCSINAIILSGRGMPLMLHYLRSDSGFSATASGRTQGTSEWGLDWRPRLRYARNLDLNYRDSSANVVLPTSFFQTSNSQRVLHLGANDQLFGWEWSGSFNRASQDVTAIGLTELPEAAVQNALNHSWSVGRDFFDRLFSVNLGEDYSHADSSGSIGLGSFRSADYHGSVYLRPSPKFGAGFSYAIFRFDNGFSRSGNIPGVAPTTVLALPSITQRTLDATASWRPWRFLSFTGGLDYLTVTPQANAESIETIVMPKVSAAVSFRSHGVDFSSTAGITYQVQSSNLGRQGRGSSPSLSASAAWGRINRVRWSSSFQWFRQPLPLVIGSFNQNGRAALRGESTYFDGWRVSGSVEYDRGESRSVGGDFRSRGFGLEAAVNRSRYGFHAGRRHMSGAGSIFQTLFPTDQFLIHLPITALAASPLLNTVNTTTNAGGNLRLGGVTLDASWNHQRFLAAQANQTYSSMNLSGRYRIGRAALDVIYTRNLTETMMMGVSGARFNQFRVRVSRAFTLL